MSDAQTGIREQQIADEAAALHKLIAEKDEAIEELVLVLDRLVFDASVAWDTLKPGSEQLHLEISLGEAINLLEKYKPRKEGER